MKGGSSTPDSYVSQAYPHSCTDGLGAALLEQLGVKFVVKGHLHGKCLGKRNHESSLPLNIFFPVGFQLVTLWLRGLHTP